MSTTTLGDMLVYDLSPETVARKRKQKHAELVRRMERRAFRHEFRRVKAREV